MLSIVLVPATTAPGPALESAPASIKDSDCFAAFGHGSAGVARRLVERLESEAGDHR